MSNYRRIYPSIDHDQWLNRGATLDNGDPCPVCATLHRRGKDAIFCSPTCTAHANTWRRKLHDYLTKVRVLDFQLEFIDCTYPKIHIPEYMHKFYPVGQTSFIAVPPGFADIRVLSVAEIWDVIFDEIGTHAARFIRDNNFNSRKHADIIDYRREYEAWLVKGLQTSETHFICDQCNMLYLDGALTHWYSEFRCEPCSKQKQPF